MNIHLSKSLIFHIYLLFDLAQMTIILDLTTKQSLIHNYQIHRIMDGEMVEGCGNRCGQHFPN